MLEAGDESDRSAAPARKLRVVLDARVWDRASGGVQQWVIGLAAAFSALEPTGDEYLFLVDPGREAWLEPFVSGPCQIVTSAAAPHRPSALSSFRGQVAERVPAARSAWRRLASTWRSGSAIPPSDGTIERLKANVMHFTFQEGFTTGVPSLYQPWDLQHLHLPLFFSAQERARREAVYRAFCAQAHTVVVASKWVKRDLVARYGIAEERVSVVNVPPVTTAYPEITGEELVSIRGRLGVPDRFIFYPAQTWPHKNHARLIHALGSLRASGLRVPLVCTGEPNEHNPAVARAVRKAGLEDDVVFLGFVPPRDVEALYHMARALVFPSLFEGWGMPVLEAFRARLPVACSNATSLPDLVGDAALVFDPTDVATIAAAIQRVWTDDLLASRLAELGRRRVGRFSWERTALTLRANYRRTAGWPMDDQDRELLDTEPLV
jgi:glycosyltransferase involved in cell wall biosynthesis